MQRLGDVSILCVNVNITIDTMLKFDPNVNAKLIVTLNVNGL